MEIRKVLRFLLSILQTLYFNFLVLEIKDAVRLPFYLNMISAQKSNLK